MGKALLVVEMILSITTSIEVVRVDLKTVATVNGLYHDTVASYNDSFRAGSGVAVLLTVLTGLLYIPVGLAGVTYHQTASKNAAMLVQ